MLGKVVIVLGKGRLAQETVYVPCGRLLLYVSGFGGRGGGLTCVLRYQVVGYDV